jgi:DHA3 family macrolide efflux protein-like MFS transporter
MTTTDTNPNAHWARRFFTIWGGQAFSLLGSQLVQFALVWWLASTTQSATVLAMATLFAILPQVFISPFAGALVDRWNRRLIMIAADAAVAVTTVGLIVLYATGNMEVWHVYAAMLLRATFGAFHFPAMQASTSLLVPSDQLARISGLNEGLRGLINIAAPPLGALLLTFMPLHQVLAVDIVTAALAILPLLFIAIPQPENRTVSSQGNLAKAVVVDIREGFRYVRAWPGLLALILVAMAINFILIPSSSLMPLLVTQHFGGGAAQLAWLESVMGIGVVLGGVTLAAWGGFKRKVMTAMVGLVGIGVGVIMMGLAPASVFVLALAGMFIMGFMNPLTNGPLFAIIQATVQPDMQGRVMSLLMSGAGAMMPISLLLAGPLADVIGVQTWYLIGGVACVLIAVGCLFVKPLMNIESNSRDATASGVESVAPALVPEPARGD